MSQYSIAGNQNLSSVNFHISDDVDLEGTKEKEKDERKVQDVVVSGKKRGLSLKTSGILLGLVLMAFSICFISNFAQKSALTKEITQLNASIEETMKEIRLLNVDVLEARDSLRICYKAVHEFHMVASEGAETYYVEAPPTRPQNGDYNPGTSVKTGSL